MLAQDVIKFARMANEGFFNAFRCYLSISAGSNSVLMGYTRGMGNISAPKTKMVRAQLKQHAWTDDVMVKDEFNELIKRSRLLGTADIYIAIDQFRALTEKANVFDYMAVKMASIITCRLSWEEGKKILETHYMSHGAECRYAGEASLVDEHVEGALRRILKESTYKTARHFYCSLIDLRFCKVKDGALKICLQYLLNKCVDLTNYIASVKSAAFMAAVCSRIYHSHFRQLKNLDLTISNYIRGCYQYIGEIKYAIDELDYFSKRGKHGSLATVTYLVLRAAFKTNDALFEKAMEIIRANVKSRLQQICIIGSVYLAEGFHIRFVNLLRKENHNIRIEDVEFICTVSRKCKEPSILESFVDVHELFGLTDELRAGIYSSLTEIYGKAKDVDGLLRTWERVVAEKNLNNFRVVILKLGHFYRMLQLASEVKELYEKLLGVKKWQWFAKSRGRRNGKLRGRRNFC